MSIGSRAGFAAFGLVVFGVALGVGGDHLWLAHRMQTPVVALEVTHEESMYAMLGTLDLTEAQHTAIQEIIDRYHSTVEHQVAAVHTRLLPTMDSARVEIEAALNPEQLRVFHGWINTEHERLDPTPHSLIRH
jgi:hypothetical protein